MRFFLLAFLSIQRNRLQVLVDAKGHVIHFSDSGKEIFEADRILKIQIIPTGAHARIGNSVEVKNAQIGDYTKALSLAYIGDADIGENVNYGSGSIIANFDGNVKNRTKIGDNSFIGSNTSLIAPVRIADNAYIAAGSTITDDVPAYSMAIARNRQIVKENWVLNKKRVRSQKETDQ